MRYLLLFLFVSCASGYEFTKKEVNYLKKTVTQRTACDERTQYAIREPSIWIPFKGFVIKDYEIEFKCEDRWRDCVYTTLSKNGVIKSEKLKCTP